MAKIQQASTPVPPALSAPAFPELPTQINKATRERHTALNRLIISRLPKALPPQSNDPSTFGFGLTRFGAIYLAFETVWDGLDLTPESQSPQSPHQGSIFDFLRTLRPVGLQRSSRLQDDLTHISHRTTQSLEAQVDTVFVTRLTQTAREKPHILIAYAWVMYMAVFSGGRWIRKQFASTPVEYWLGNDAHGLQETAIDLEPHEIPGLSFLSFDGTEDGEDIKIAFKTRLRHADDLLTTEERQDIVDEAQFIFDYCIQTVHELDAAAER